MTDLDRDQLAQDTAEYIATVLMPRHAGAAYGPKPPADVATIKAVLLDGRMWISWTDDRVCAAMRALHGAPGPDAEWLVGDRGQAA